MTVSEAKSKDRRRRNAMTKRLKRICHDRYDCRYCMSEHAKHDAVTHRPIYGYSYFTVYRVNVGIRP
jgi:hypothetical protein